MRRNIMVFSIFILFLIFILPNKTYSGDISNGSHELVSKKYLKVNRISKIQYIQKESDNKKIQQMGFKNISKKINNNTFESNDYGLTWIEKKDNFIFKVIIKTLIINSKSVTLISDDSGLTWNKVNGTQDKMMEDWIIKIYPNPVLHCLNISNLGNKITNIQVFNLFGELVRSYENSNDTLFIDTSSLQSGTYILNISNINVGLKSFKFTKI